MLATAARVLIAWRTNLSLALLAVAVGSFLAADFFYGKQLVNGTWSTGSVVDLGFLAFSVLCGTAALTRSMGQVASLGLARHQLGLMRLTVLALGVLVAPTVLFVEATSGAVTTGVAIAVVTASVGVVMLFRLYLTAQAYRGRAHRERAVRVASYDLVLARTDKQVLDSVARAVAKMLPTGELSGVELVHREHAVISGERDPHDHAGVVTVPLRSASDPPDTEPGRATPSATPVLVVRGPPAQLAELDQVLRGLADQAASAISRIGLVADLEANERERYFRTLVLTSDDVTLISRGAVVCYATPSARTMFGRDVTGLAVGDLIHGEQGPPDWWTVTSGEEATVVRPDAEVIVWVRSRDLQDDPSIAGVVTTLRDITAERRLQADLAYRASHDPLTGLANAQLFSDELHADEELARPPAERRGRALSGRAALFIDLDDFKTVNDTYGHHVGDQLLAEVAGRIEACLRAEDVAARLGGDEFAVFLRDVTEHDARGVAERIAGALATPATIGEVVVDCRAGVGLRLQDRFSMCWLGTAWRALGPANRQRRGSRDWTVEVTPRDRRTMSLALLGLTAAPLV